MTQDQSIEFGNKIIDFYRSCYADGKMAAVTYPVLAAALTLDNYALGASGIDCLGIDTLLAYGATAGASNSDRLRRLGHSAALAAPAYLTAKVVAEPMFPVKNSKLRLDSLGEVTAAMMVSYLSALCIGRLFKRKAKRRSAVAQPTA